MILFPLQVTWGKISMVDAERRLLANALQDIDNQHFVLLSDRYISWFCFHPILFRICSFRSLIFFCVFAAVYLCTILIMYMTTWWGQISVLLTGNLFLYLKFISNYKSIIGVYLIALGSTFTLDDLVDFPAGFWVGLLFLQLTSYFVFFISFYDPGPHGNFRYSQNMLPEVTETDFRKGSQVILQSSLLIFFNLRSFWWRSLFWL